MCSSGKEPEKRERSGRVLIYHMKRHHECRRNGMAAWPVLMKNNQHANRKRRGNLSIISARGGYRQYYSGLWHRGSGEKLARRK